MSVKLLLRILSLEEDSLLLYSLFSRHCGLDIGIITAKACVRLPFGAFAKRRGQRSRRKPVPFVKSTP
jgi:hypothetical protein